MSDLNHITDELYRLHTIIAEQNEKIAALEREVEALALRTEKAIDAIAASHQGILDNCRCPNLRGGRADE